MFKNTKSICANIPTAPAFVCTFLACLFFTQSCFAQAGSLFGSTEDNTITGYCFSDTNQNGFMDGDEYGLPDTKVSIKKLNIFLQTIDERETVTDDRGSYSFSGLSKGLYLVYADDSAVVSTKFNPSPCILGFFRSEAVNNFGIYIQQPSAVSVSISSDPPVIKKGESAALEWTSENADSLSIDQGIGDVDAQGSVTVSPVQTTLYTITAAGQDAATVSDSVTVVVLDETTQPPPSDGDTSSKEPSVIISANPPAVQPGGKSTLIWSSSHAESASINPDVGEVDVTGSHTIKNLQETTTYIITVEGPGGQAMAKTTIELASSSGAGGGSGGSSEGSSDGSSDEPSGGSTDTLTDLPHIVGAVSTGTRSVRLAFSKPMSSDAADASNYNIVHEDSSGSGSHLLITGAQFVSNTNSTMVNLTTMPQTEITYRLTAVATDKDGNSLAPKHTAGGIMIDPSSAVFLGTPPDTADLTDSDNDTLSDAAEQAGWSVFVTRADGQVVSSHVTSSPYLMDTDNDSLPDNVEKTYGTNPRSSDTDSDNLTDAEELNMIYSSPYMQDTDGDTLADGLEFSFFKTSPLIADTDGDQFTDDEEILDLDRDPLIADLPRPQIIVGDVRLSLDVRSTYTDETGTEQTVQDSMQTTLSESSAQSFGTSDTVTNEKVLEYGQKIGTQVSYSTKDGFGITGSFEASFGQTYANGFSSTRSQQTANTSASEYQNSVTHAFTESHNRSVTRTVENAKITVDVSIKNTSDIAFTITNIELSVLRQDRRNSYRFIPIASLRLSGASNPNDQPEFNLGPFDPERGPFIFESTGAYPNLVEELMKDPQGLVYRVVNFDILDEFGRNFVFSSQEINDRTAGITIDFGEGEVEKYRVATHNTFADNGTMQPITMQRALEIIGITKSTSPSGDTPGADPDNDTVRSTYGTQTTVDGVEILTRVRAVQTDLLSPSNPEKRFWTVISSNRTVPSTVDFSDIPLRARDNFLLVFTRDQDQDGLLEREEIFNASSDTDNDTDGDGISDYDEVRTGWSVTLKGTGVYKVFSSPASSDSDFDGLRDDEEMLYGTDPTKADTDFDGLNDVDEIYGPIEIVLFDGDSDELNNPVLFVPQYFGPPSIVNGFDGICSTTATGDDVQQVSSGSNAVDGEVLITAGPNEEIDTSIDLYADDYIRVAHDKLYLTDPLYRDTDRDSMTDGREAIVGVNPNRDDAGSIIDNDHDGLSDSEERMGWTIMINQNGMNNPQTIVVTSDAFRADTDRDGIPDVYERAIKTNPRLRDTDNDSLLDWNEFDANDIIRYDANALADADMRCNDATSCVYDPPQSSELTGTDPRETDSDADGLSDLAEITFGSDPNAADTDGDGLNDKSEQDEGTDPNSTDTDADGVNDYIEVQRGTDPLFKDKLIKFELLRIECPDANDEGAAPLDCIEVYGTWSLDVGNTNYIDYGLSDYQFCDGDTVDTTSSAQIRLRDGETISFTTSNVYEEDPSSSNDTFSNLNINYSYSTITSGTFSNSITGSDGQLDTYHRITIINGIP